MRWPADHPWSSQAPEDISFSLLPNAWFLCAEPQRGKKLWGEGADDPKAPRNSESQLLKLNVFPYQQFNKVKILHYEFTTNELPICIPIYVEAVSKQMRSSPPNAFGNGKTHWSLCCDTWSFNYLPILNAWFIINTTMHFAPSLLPDCRQGYGLAYQDQIHLFLGTPWICIQLVEGEV